MRKLLTSYLLASLSLISLPAEALMPPCCVPVCWEGFYASGQLGMAQDREQSRFTTPNYFNTIGPAVIGTVFTHKAQGVTGGGALGVNYQSDWFVIGLEGGAVSTNLKKTRPSPFFPGSDVFTSHLSYIANGKLRMGYASESLLIFAAGGWAGGHHTLKLEDTNANVEANLKTWMNGWTLGIGFDCKFAERLSLGVEYDYYQLEEKKRTASCSRCGSGVGLGSPQLDTTINMQMVTVRLNYFFY